MAAVSALGVPLDLGFVFPPKPGELKGFGKWTNRDLTAAEIEAMLPTAAAANFRGGNVFMRLGPGCRDHHPGIILIDDLVDIAVEQLARDGLEPSLVVETSKENFQAWVRIHDGTVPYEVVGAVARHLAETYGGDPRAVSPRQPGRLAGFTNRKLKHRRSDGSFPFVRLTHMDKGRVASRGSNLIEKALEVDTARAARGAPPETPQFAASTEARHNAEITAWLNDNYEQQVARLRRETARGIRSAAANSNSEADFAVARAALAEGIDRLLVINWIALHRQDKGWEYASRTVEAARRWQPERRVQGAEVHSLPFKAS